MHSSAVQATLHSTMFLLIPVPTHTYTSSYFFTFHYVSINTGFALDNNAFQVPLHSTMFLLILKSGYFMQTPIQSLHSTMFLLIRERPFLAAFCCLSLHSTMFLLILLHSVYCMCFGRSLHSTMFLLIRGFPPLSIWKKFIFTFHYVSINTSSCYHFVSNLLIFTFHYVSINTRTIVVIRCNIFLYIPLCFY